MPLPPLNRWKRSLNISPLKGDLTFPKGFFGFEDYTHFVLYSYPNEAPYLRIESRDSAPLNFYVIDPFLNYPNYTPQITKKDLEDLLAEDGASLILLGIVYIQEIPNTVNLSAPLLIHWEKKLGKQLLFQDVSSFPLPL